MIPDRFFGDHGDAARYIELTKEDMLLCIGIPIIFGAIGKASSKPVHWTKMYIQHIDGEWSTFRWLLRHMRWPQIPLRREGSIHLFSAKSRPKKLTVAAKRAIAISREILAGAIMEPGRGATRNIWKRTRKSNHDYARLEKTKSTTEVAAARSSDQ